MKIISTEDHSTLTDNQRQGYVCVNCGRVPIAPRLAADDQNSRLVRCSPEDSRACAPRVYWLTSPCPEWCIGDHGDGDAGSDRDHRSQWQGHVPLVLEPGEKMSGGLPHQPEYVTSHLEQGYREIGPRIWCGKGETNHGWHMTPEEARELAATLNAAVALATSPKATAPHRNVA